MPRIRPHTCETGWGISRFKKTHLNIANTHLPTKDIYCSKHLPVLTASNYRAQSIYLSVLKASIYLCSKHLPICAYSIYLSLKT